MRKLNGREEELKWERGRDEKREERKWRGREGSENGGEILTKFWFH